MKLIWNFFEEDKRLEAVFLYNVYIEKKELYIDNDKVLLVKRNDSSNEFSFIYNGKEYGLELILDGHGYSGYVITPEGEKVPPKVESKVLNKNPLWIIPFVIVNMIIPVISVEAVTPWIIGILASYITAEISQKQGLNTKVKIAIALIISIFAWAGSYVYYLMARSIGLNGGFLPFIK